MGSCAGARAQAGRFVMADSTVEVCSVAEKKELFEPDSLNIHIYALSPAPIKVSRRAFMTLVV